jgi:predicted anti-sigma-YlaC factor YlaD
MKCDDVEKALKGDSGDLDAVKHHLENCPECSRKYRQDLELEVALRNLSLMKETVDITDKVREAIRLIDRRRNTMVRKKKWVWVTTSVIAAALLIVSIPFLAGWLSAAFSLINNFEFGPVYDFEASPSQYVHFFYLMIAVVVWVFWYLWRVAKIEPIKSAQQ